MPCSQPASIDPAAGRHPVATPSFVIISGTRNRARVRRTVRPDLRGPICPPQAQPGSGPGDLPMAGDEAPGARAGPLRGEGDDRVRALRNGLGAAVTVEVSGGVAGVGGVDADSPEPL